MSTRILEHYNIRTTCFAETVRFYTAALGLKRGHYPGKILPGAWIYDENDVPVVHIVDLDRNDPEAVRKADEATVTRAPDSLRGSGAIDHIAFLASGYDDFCARLAGQGISYKQRDVQAGLRQIYVMDPNEILIELNFRETVGA